MKKTVSITIPLALASIVFGQSQKATDTPFTLTWTSGKCAGCKTAVEVREIQFVSRNEAWGGGNNDGRRGLYTVIVHTTDAGRTWREVPRTEHYTDPDGLVAFSLPNAARGWIATWWDMSVEPQLIRTLDAGKHWDAVAHEFFQHMQFVDESHGFGTLADEFFALKMAAASG